MQHPSRVDMRDRDKHTVHGAGLLPVFATRARSVEKTLVHASVLFKTIFFSLHSVPVSVPVSMPGKHQQQHGAQNVEKRMRDTDTDESESKTCNFGVWVSKLVFSQSSIYTRASLIISAHLAGAPSFLSHAYCSNAYCSNVLP